MDVLQLRQSLASILTNELGTYRLANGYETPAVSVRAVGEPMTPGTTVTGMELVLVRDPAQDPVRQYREPGAFDRWSAYLVDWGGGSGDLGTAAGIVLQAYPGTTITDLSVPESVGPQHQKRLEILAGPYTLPVFDDFVINLLLENGGNLLLESGGQVLLEV